ncbi:sugar ABC transporter permease [Salinibacterium xinjiangense]|uniref:Carbohydrate ABC transporter membrane protein 2, CUT1 family n=1 Tax=Salinibacterium xinjiangense TaxID=386302 RepID=A0A2C8ZAA3_9MICO|nr:carbohydrate ABC transporter permease [Salinibacterium xinjiangense]GGK90716.1 sugar ABC transporter permease [Salinibacterium xinjiangense]SOE60922.1 carbohydrate ABC transporter membrane protein 2, CUT1 family [Salinibacterium xinjiangense]
MSAVAPIDLPVDQKTKTQLGRGARAVERSTLRKSKARLTSKGATIAAIVIAILWTTPTLGLLITSFRPPELINTSGWWSIFTNPGFTLGNYDAVLNGSATTVSLGQSFINSIAITLPAALFPLVIASLAAYAFAWIPFKGRNILFIGVFALQVVPIQMALVPLLSLFARGLSIGDFEIFAGLGAGGNSYGQVWIAHTIFALPLAIFLLHNFISEIPQELIEAARVDGAGHGQTFFRIVLPLAMPAIASFAIFQFLWVWNDLLVALVFADGAVGPITKVLREITGNRGQDWYLLTSGAFIAMIVPLIVFFALQRFFVRGLLAGSTKG